MATRITTTQIEGIGVHDSRINEETLQPVGTLSADYTQAGAYPGRPVAQQTTAMALESSGAQTDKGDLRVRTSRAGSAGADEGAFLYRDVAAGEGATQYQGWDGFQAVTGSEGLYRSAGTGAGGSDVAVLRLDSGKVLAVYKKASISGIAAELYDPALGTWSSPGFDVVGGSIAAIPTVGLVELLPEARVLAYVPNSDNRNIIAVYSDQEGAGWADASRNVLRTDLPAGVTINEIRAAYSDGEVLLFVQYTDGGVEELAQYASADRGLRFDLVAETWGVTGEAPDTCSVEPLKGGGFLLAYSDPTGSPKYQSRRVGSAFENAQDASAVTIATNPSAGRSSISAWSDEDGVLYCLATIIDGAASWALRLFRSIDRGDSWDVWGGPVAELNPGAVDTELNEFAATSTGGLGILVTRYTAPSDGESNSAVVVVYLGGHSSHTLPATDEAVDGTVLTNFPDTAFISWAQSDDNGKPGGLYLPIDKPQNVGWTAAGGGSSAITAAQELEITTSAAVRSFRHVDTDATVTSCTGEAEVEIDSGSGDDTGTAIALDIWLSDYDGTPASATFTYGITIRLDDAGWSLYDENGTPTIVGAPVTQDTTGGIKIRWTITSNGFVKTWWTIDGPQRKVWTEGPGGSLTNTTADRGNEVRFGHVTTGTAVSRWTLVGYCFWGWRWSVQSSSVLASSWANPGDLHGRHYSPFPLLIHDGVKIAAVDGPSYLGEIWEIAPSHRYALNNIHPSVSPSPRRGWRNTADSVVEYIVWKMDDDFDSARMLNHPLVVVALESNLESFEVQGYDGAAWQAMGTATSTDDWDSLGYDRRGRTLIPEPGVSTVGERYFHYGGHVGDTVDLGLGSDTLHKIERNTEGAWRGATETKKPTIVLDGDNLPGALPDTAQGTMKIRRKDFGIVIHSYSDTYHALRIKIPSQATADGDYRIGQLFLGHVQAFARPHDLGWSEILEMDVEQGRRTGGTRRDRKRGPSRRLVEIAWVDSWTDATQIRASQPDPDFIRAQTSAAVAVGTPRDTIEMVAGLHDEQDGSVSPVLYLKKITTTTAGTHALTDRREFVYGRLETSPRIDNTLGRQGTSDANRLNTITIREEK